MSNTSERLAALKAEQEELVALVAAEDAAAKAKAAYRENPTEARKAKHREAAASLSEARSAFRSRRPEAETPVAVDSVAATSTANQH